MSGAPRETLVQYQPAVPKRAGSAVDQSKKQPLVTIDPKSTIEDILNAMLPPREWTAEGNTFIQFVSPNSASREDVTNLQKLLDQRLGIRQARDSGICPIREQLHNQCFDEIIRQVTIDCPQRGLLLMRVRDELKMTISAYETLYESSVTFGMRKQLQSEQGTPQLQEQVYQLQKKKEELGDKRDELIKKKAIIENQIKQRKIAEDKKRIQQIEFLKYQANHLQGFLRNANEANK